MSHKEGDDQLEEPIRRILRLLRGSLQVDLSQYKPTTLRRRFQRHMMLCKFDDLEAYAAYLSSHPEALKELHDEIFIHVTEFFRDGESFDGLREQVFPALLKDRGADDPIRIWVPGCSTGEEPYSIAMALREFLDEHDSAVPFQIFATDISEAAVRRARRAVYAKNAVGAIGASRLERYFEETSEGYKVRRELREACVISKHDITRNPPFARLDLVSCRNVLIYFGPELQKRVLPVFHYALKPGAFLWLGQSETPGGFTRLFSAVDKKNKIYSKRAPDSATPVGLGENDFAPARLELPRRSSLESLHIQEYQRGADQLLLYKYAPPAVVVGQDFEILQFRGRTAPYLEPSNGLPSHNLLKMAHPQLVSPLKALTEQAMTEGMAMRQEGVAIEVDEATRSLNLEVVPLNPTAPARERHYLVVFEEPAQAGLRRCERRAPAARTEASTDTREAYIDQLQNELDSRKESQQSLVEQFDSMQEELRSANEEMQATNEELQATNEELESAQEELQASNEELTTMNDELQARNQELSNAIEKLGRSEERFRLMVDGVRDYAIFMLDTLGNITSWNEGARRFKGYEASEAIGMHFSRFYTPEDIARGHPDYELRVAVRDGRYEEEGWRVRKDGTRFWANVVITRINDANGRHIGFAKVTRDLTERRRSEEQLRQANEQLERRVLERTRELELALRTRDEFLSIASHELKTPLTSLKLQLQLTRRKIKFDPDTAPPPREIAAAMDLGVRQVNSLASLVDSLLDVARIQTGRFDLEPSDVSLSELVEDVVGRLSQQLAAVGSRAELKLEKGIRGHWDRFRLEQVVNNLMSNAMKYAPGEPIVISTRSRDGRAELVIEDRGPGIAEEQQEKIFERFERVNRDRHVGGLGLGLFIVRRIVEGHGGTIRVESRPGDGARFVVELPCSKAT